LVTSEESGGFVSSDKKKLLSRRGKYVALVVEGTAAAPVAALLHGLTKAPSGSKVVAVLSGGNVNLDQLKGLKWN
jgi:threonine dehydratase